ncbi:MAG: DUF58 domain-containing protein [Planctomycetales bacterium]|nr:DUF58 domain-containing protein [Planctomycetales bacterium]
MTPLPEPNIAEVLKQVQRIQIVANRSVNELFAGQYKSVFRGRGMEFDEVREYQPGDDIRSIDWNVTARAGSPFIKRFCEERELTVLFLVDVSASGLFGTGDRAKLELIVEVAALLMFSALKNNDKVGLMTFCDEPISYFPARKGKGNVLRLIREMVTTRAVARSTRLAPALQFVNRIQKRRAVIFLISDFLCELPRDALAITHRRHELTAITVTDPREHALPRAGIMTFRDAESGARREVDTSSRRVREQFVAWCAQREQQRTQMFRRLGIDELLLLTRPHDETADEHSHRVPHYVTELRRFMQARTH